MTNQTDEKTGDPAGRTLLLWDAVQATDPKHTKNFSGNGGFSGTAINPTYQVRRATEKFGPIGIGWGFDIVDEKYVEGAPIGVNEKGDVTARIIVHHVRMELWYTWQGARGAVRRSGATTFVGKNRNGVFTDEEAAKKSETDALMKCLTMLGFSADVHMGLYDDCKYVDELRVQFGAEGFDGEPVQPGSQSAVQGNADDTANPKLSARYQMYRDRLKAGAITDKKLARQTIKSDKDLGELERSLLLASPELKVEGETVASDTTFI